MPFADESPIAAPLPYRPSWPGEFGALEVRLLGALGGVGSRDRPRRDDVDPGRIAAPMSAFGFRLGG